MSDLLFDRLAELSPSAINALTGILRGIEKEGLRVDRQGFIAQTPHPACLGHALTHPQITTDYSESLLELITPAYNNVNQLLARLDLIHRYAQGCLGDEVLWAGSMPCRLQGDASVPIAEYGESNIGRLKHIYRRGLEHRYGRVMQSIAGLHYNFSLPDAFWLEYQTQLGDDQSLQDFKSAQYFALIRNFRRNAWLLMYLFGASPAADRSFLEGRNHRLRPFDADTLYLPHATSLRMSDLGYQSNAQASLKICFNYLNTYTETLYQAIHTPYQPYADIGVKGPDGEYRQLNANILQIENEYYSTMRPKRTTLRGEKPVQALRARGVEYVEVRCMDLDPFLPLGVDGHGARFLDAFLLYCLLDASPYIGDSECQRLDDNFSKSVMRGREQGLLMEWRGELLPVAQAASRLLERIGSVSELLADLYGDDGYRAALRQQQDKVRQPELTPSARILDVLEQEGISYLELVQELSRKHQVLLRANPINNEQRAEFDQLREQSLAEEAAIRAADQLSFEQFLQQYIA